jgi:hypothetical protein
MAKNTDPNALYALAWGLQAVAARMEPADAARRTAEAAPLLVEAMAKNTDPNALYFLTLGLQAAASKMEPAEAARLLVEAMAKNTDPFALDHLAQGLLTVVATMGPGESSKRNVLVARAVGELLSPPTRLSGLATLAQSTHLSGSPPTTQQLVDVLKMPTCVGPPHAVILALLGQRYGRAFADQWEFVDYAHEHLPDLDLTTPPKRPKP